MEEVCPLEQKKCVPCRGGVPPLSSDEIKPLFEQLSGWKVVENHHLEKDYRFKDFKEALSFVNKVGSLAEQEGHHPDLLLSWGRVVMTLWTHKINGLSESDFILAAKCDAL
jgi:4a-hydroxytetrahydrobiopterin dehydratase